MTANGLDIKGTQITRRPSRRYQRPTSGHNTITISQRTYIITDIIQRRANTRSHNPRANGKFNAWITPDKSCVIVADRGLRREFQRFHLLERTGVLGDQKIQISHDRRVIRRKTCHPSPRNQTRRPHQLLFKLKTIPRASIIHFNEHSDRSSVGDWRATSFPSQAASPTHLLREGCKQLIFFFFFFFLLTEPLVERYWLNTLNKVQGLRSKRDNQKNYDLLL